MTRSMEGYKISEIVDHIAQNPVSGLGMGLVAAGSLYFMCTFIEYLSTSHTYDRMEKYLKHTTASVGVVGLGILVAAHGQPVVNSLIEGAKSLTDLLK